MSLPANLPRAGERKLPRWGPTLLHTFTVAFVLLLFLALPAGILGMALSADPNDRANEDKRAVGFLFAAIMGGPLVLTLVYQQTRAFRRRRLFQHGELRLADITEATWVTTRTSNGASARRLRIQWHFPDAGKEIVGSFAPDPLQLGGIPFEINTGDAAILVVDPKKPKRHEAYGFIDKRTGRAWWPGA